MHNVTAWNVSEKRDEERAVQCDVGKCHGDAAAASLRVGESGVRLLSPERRVRIERWIRCHVQCRVRRDFIVEHQDLLHHFRLECRIDVVQIERAGGYWVGGRARDLHARSLNGWIILIPYDDTQKGHYLSSLVRCVMACKNGLNNYPSCW